GLNVAHASRALRAYERSKNDGEPHSRFEGRVARSPQGVARQREGVHAPAGRAQSTTTRSAVGARHQRVLLRGITRERTVIPPLYRKVSANRLSFHVRPGVGGGV